jgi:hypothetical protein
MRVPEGDGRSGRSSEEDSMPRHRFRLGLAGAAIGAATALGAATATAATPPTATTGAATQITYNSAVVEGSANPEGISTEVYFQYGTSKSYGQTSAPIPLTGDTTQAVSATLHGLAAYTTYDYRVVSVNANGTTYGAEKHFTTLKIPLSLQIAATPNPITYGGLLTVAGTLSGTGNANQPVALQQNPYPYTAGFTQTGNAELTSSTGAYSFTVSALDMSTQYRVVNTKNPNVVSPTVLVTDSLLVTLHSHAVGTREHRAARIFGTVEPASETDAKFAIQELFGKTWKLINGGITAGTASGGVVHFSKVVHLKRSGFIRVFVGTVQGANAESFSPPIAVRGY